MSDRMGILSEKGPVSLFFLFVFVRCYQYELYYRGLDIVNAFCVASCCV